jgi:hypothetical protein
VLTWTETYTAHGYPCLESIPFQCREFAVQRNICRVHRRHLKSCRIEESERVEQVSKSTGVDESGWDLVACAFSRVPALVVSNAAALRGRPRSLSADRRGYNGAATEPLLARRLHELRLWIYAMHSLRPTPGTISRLHRISCLLYTYQP